MARKEPKLPNPIKLSPKVVLQPQSKSSWLYEADSFDLSIGKPTPRWRDRGAWQVSLTVKPPYIGHIEFCPSLHPVSVRAAFRRCLERAKREHAALTQIKKTLVPVLG